MEYKQNEETGVFAVGPNLTLQMSYNKLLGSSPNALDITSEGSVIENNYASNNDRCVDMFGTRRCCIVEQNKLKDNHFFGRTIGYSKHIVFNIKIFGEQIVAAAKATFNITISIQYQVKIVSAEIHHFKLDI